MELVSDEHTSNIYELESCETQKKRNARMKDALDEALILSHS
jgi:hypothetical protein